MPRPPRAPAEPKDEDLSEGLVVRVDSRLCRVRIDSDTFDCRVRGLLFRKEKTYGKPVAVGDLVMVRRLSTLPYVVESVLPRRNVLARPRYGTRHNHIIAANLDLAVLVTACAEPPINPRLIDRMLVACERSGYRAVIVFNKADLLANREPIEELAELYRGLEYAVHLTSVVTGEGTAGLRQDLSEGISVFAGMSGVGKSALLTAIQPDLSLKSAEVSDATGKGRHTTTRVSLLELEGGGYVVDTPGVREFGVIDMTAAEISHCFREFHPHLNACRFRTCTHDHEIKCEVKAACDRGDIDPLRYDSYLRIINSLDKDY
ncbi:MAG: ribosome small subunit-dependent GTPase A [Planctomycetota bacterium]